MKEKDTETQFLSKSVLGKKYNNQKESKFKKKEKRLW